MYVPLDFFLTSEAYYLYCDVNIKSQKKSSKRSIGKTASIQNTHNPNWNEELKFAIASVDDILEFNLVVEEKGKLSHNKVSEWTVDVPANQLMKYATSTVSKIWYDTF